MNQGIVIWLTGLPGSGKSTVAKGLKDIYPDFVILNMDEMRKLVTPKPTYSDSERDIVYRAIVFLAKILSDNGLNVIIDATGNLRKWRDLARDLIKTFLEVYLKCPLNICIEREEKRVNKHSAPNNIYKKAKEGWPVPGINVPYEEPLNPDIVVDSERFSINEIVKIVDNKIKELKLTLDIKS